MCLPFINTTLFDAFATCLPFVSMRFPYVSTCLPLVYPFRVNNQMFKVEKNESHKNLYIYNIHKFHFFLLKAGKEGRSKNTNSVKVLMWTYYRVYNLINK